MSATRYTSAKDASAELYATFNVWTGKLSAYGPQIAFALVAANWAIHGSRAQMLANTFAKWSLVVAVGYLAFLLPAMYLMIGLLRGRMNYADADRGRWEIEAAEDAALAPGVKTSWPYNKRIDWSGRGLHLAHVLAAFVSGSLLALSVFLGGPPLAEQKVDAGQKAVVADSSGLEHIGDVENFLVGNAANVQGGDAAFDTAVQDIATTWIRMRSKGRSGVLLVVGSSDRLKLSSAQQERFDANIGLAQARAEEVKFRLLNLLNKQAPNLAPRSDEILVLASGPNHAPLPERCVNCTRAVGFPEDRRVDIWAFWGATPKNSTQK
ncbi:hypothetical protein [Paraburkholderia bannensis]|uniref:hypothetical protein n=1 Tax=Paraburkholderia bannensis TaxID=765414 RepID=UPI002ABD9A2D|nr:hypothetical protein [Paraburkholderia bannensis]